MSGSAIVACHPDDEILWFSSLIESVDKTVICLLDAPQIPHLLAGRLKVKEAYPLKNLHWLGVKGSQAAGCADWADLKPSPYGVELPKVKVPGEYERSFAEIQARLEPLLMGMDRVTTHNPWGEYGHEEHIQVHRAVASLQKRCGFELWFSNYCSQHSFPFMLSHIQGFSSDYETRATRPELSERVKKLFQAENCWTWFDDWTPFKEECFMKLSSLPQPAVNASGHLFPLNLIRQLR